MTFYFLKNKKIGLTVLIAIVAIIVVLVPEEAHADGMDYILSGAIGFTTYILNYIIGFIGGVFFALSAYLVQWAIGFNEGILNNQAVRVGWDIVLNFANLGFVLAIIIIAFATIFRLENYAIKQTLWKLIVTALLVNFSLVIAGAFISVSDITAKYFQDASKLGPRTAADTLGSVFNNQRLMNVGDENCNWIEENFVDSTNGACLRAEEGTTKRASTWRAGILAEFTCKCDLNTALTAAKEKGGFDNLSTEFLTMIASLFFSVIFSFLGVLTLLATFVMLLIRYVALGFILVLSPLAWLCWILPSTQHLWKKWWDNFLRWTFFMPVMSFFMYLSIKSIEFMPILKEADVQKVLSGTFRQQGFLENVGSMLILIGFMLGGLYVANLMGIVGANIAMNLAQKAGKGAGAWAGRKTLGGLRGGYSRLAGAAKWGDKSIEASEKASDKSRSMLGRYYYGLKARTLANLSAPAEREPERYKSEVSKLTMAQTMAQLSSDSMLMPGGRKVALSEHILNNLPKVNIPGGIRREEIMEPIMEETDEMRESNLTDDKGNKIKVPTGRKIQTKVGERGTGKYEDIRDDDLAKHNWLKNNLIPDSIKNLYARSKMDFNAVEKKIGESNEMVNARKEHGTDSKEFAVAAKKFYGGLKKSDAADIGKALKRIYGNLGIRDSDEKSLAKQISIALGHNFAIISSMLPNMGGYKVVNNFQADFENANPNLDKKDIQTIFKNFRIFEGGAPSTMATAATAPTP